MEPFVHRIQVRYAEVDGHQIVFHAHLLTYCDETCSRFREALGFEEPWDLILAKSVLECRSPARFNDVIEIAVDPVRVGTKSFDLRYAATVGDRLACVVVNTYVAIVPGANTSTEIPAALRYALVASTAAPTTI